MPNRMSDAELLEQTAEWLSRLAETIERVTERLADSIAKVQAQQDATLNDVMAIEGRLDALERVQLDRGLRGG